MAYYNYSYDWGVSFEPYSATPHHQTQSTNHSSHCRPLPENAQRQTQQTVQRQQQVSDVQAITTTYNNLQWAINEELHRAPTAAANPAYPSVAAPKRPPPPPSTRPGQLNNAPAPAPAPPRSDLVRLEGMMITCWGAMKDVSSRALCTTELANLKAGSKIFLENAIAEAEKQRNTQLIEKLREIHWVVVEGNRPVSCGGKPPASPVARSQREEHTAPAAEDSAASQPAHGQSQQDDASSSSQHLLQNVNALVETQNRYLEEQRRMMEDPDAALTSMRTSTTQAALSLRAKEYLTHGVDPAVSSRFHQEWSNLMQYEDSLRSLVNLAETAAAQMMSSEQFSRSLDEFIEPSTI